MDPAELEREVERKLAGEIDAALRALPAPAAPPTLAGHVMHRVRSRAAAEGALPSTAWLRPWFAWNSRAQMGAAMGLAAIASAFAWFSGPIAAWMQSMSTAAPVAASRVVWQALEPVIAGGAVYVLVMGVVAVCAAVALAHVALEAPR